MPDGILYYDDGILCWMGYRADGIVNVQPGGDRAHFDEPHKPHRPQSRDPTFPCVYLTMSWNLSTWKENGIPAML